MPRRLASYLLGAFVCAELAYLPLANVLQRVPRQPDPLPQEILGRHQREGRATKSDSLQSAIDSTGKFCDRWAEVTAQNQGWSLFAPRFGQTGTFLTLEVVAADGSRTELRSRFEPADPSHYVRFDVLNYRLFYREMSYALVYSQWTPDSFATRGEEWRQAIRDYVTCYRLACRVYSLAGRNGIAGNHRERNASQRASIPAAEAGPSNSAAGNDCTIREMGAGYTHSLRPSRRKASFRTVSDRQDDFHRLYVGDGACRFLSASGRMFAGRFWSC